MKKNSIQKPGKAPKDGSVIIAAFKNVPWIVSATWNEPSDKWVVATPHVDLYEGKWNDTYFENGYVDHEEMEYWIDPELFRLKSCPKSFKHKYTKYGFKIED